MSGSYDYNDFSIVFNDIDLTWFMEEYGMMILAIIGIVLLVILLFSLVTYILSSVGLYTIAKRRGIKNPWMAWIPIASYWTIGCISDQYQYVVNGKVRNKRKTLLILAAAPIVLNLIVNILSTIVSVVVLSAGAEMAGVSLITSALSSILNMVLNLATLIVYYITLNDIFNSCSARNGTVFLVLSIVFPILVPFFFFAVRKKDGGMPPRRDQVVNPVYQQPHVFVPPVMPADAPPASQAPAADNYQEYL